MILSRIDYCNAVLHGTPTYTIRKLQCVQNNAARIVLQAPRRSHTLHWLPIHQRIDYKMALLTFKVRSTSTPSYLHRLLQDREASTICDDNRPLRRCADRSPKQYREAHLPLHSTSYLELAAKTVVDSVSVTSFKSRLKDSPLLSGFLSYFY